MKKYLLIYCILFGWVCSAQAEEPLANTPLDLSINAQPYLQLAQLDVGNQSESQVAAGEDSAPLFKSRALTLNKTHKYLGYASMASAILTVISPKTTDGPHELFGTAAAALGAAAVATGFAFHYEDISLDGGFDDPDNLHMMLGVLGTLGYAAAVSSGADGGHAAPGALGALAMAIAIKLTW
ncbi:MAG: hypothetical protein L3J62_10635 [Gammaproteobacteria bacterium]|nr:hypothetical protein [Gammaproteobacteria bacterium]MCF6231219.1 hypothetical protein [Gammaproteobacteria bacterium]